MNKSWRANMDSVEEAIVSKGGFGWQSFRCIDGSHDGIACRPQTPKRGAACSSFLREQCEPDSLAQTAAVQYQISHQFNAAHSAAPNLTNFEMDLGMFLASRGNYSWLGYGWLGCGCGWEYKGAMPCDVYPRPSALDLDYGTPLGLCSETGEGTGVFTREWSKSTVTVDCEAYSADIKFKK